MSHKTESVRCKDGGGGGGVRFAGNFRTYDGFYIIAVQIGSWQKGSHNSRFEGIMMIRPETNMYETSFAIESWETNFNEKRWLKSVKNIPQSRTCIHIDRI